MNRDVHLAALRAAARVAFSMALPVALVSGCAAASETSGGEESASTEDALKSSKKKPCHEDAGPAKPSCDSVLASAFPGPDTYQWEPVAASAEVVACCDKELTDKGASSAHRWACCVAYDPATVNVDAGESPAFANGHGMACTPWGPPCPPSMRRGRAAKRNPALRMGARAFLARANAKAVA